VSSVRPNRRNHTKKICWSLLYPFFQLFKIPIFYIFRSGQMIAGKLSFIDYCHKGYKIIPLRREQKIPAISNWQDRATDDPDQLKAWLSQYNSQNIGLVTGDQNGIFVLDIDTKHGAKGLEAMKALIGKHGHLPK